MSDESFQKYSQENFVGSKNQNPQFAPNQPFITPAPQVNNHPNDVGLRNQNPHFAPNQPFDPVPQVNNYPNYLPPNHNQFQNQNFQNNLPSNNQNYINPNYNAYGGQPNNNQNYINPNPIIYASNNNFNNLRPNFESQNKNSLTVLMIFLFTNMIFEFWSGISFILVVNSAYNGDMEENHKIGIILAFLNIFLILICVITFKKSCRKKKLVKIGFVLFQICIIIYILQMYIFFSSDKEYCDGYECKKIVPNPYSLAIGSILFFLSEVYSCIFFQKRMKFD